MKQQPTSARLKSRLETEQKLVLAAKDIFAEYGYDKATTRMVAQKAQVNLGLISRYFGNKHGLLLAVIDHEAREHFVKPLPYPPQKTLLEECFKYIEFKFENSVSKPEFFRIVVVQAITNADFFNVLKEKRLELSQYQHIQERLKRFTQELPTEQSRQNLIEFLTRNLNATMISQFLISHESKDKCIDYMKELIILYCNNLSKA